MCRKQEVNLAISLRKWMVSRSDDKNAAAEAMQKECKELERKGWNE